MGSAGRRTQQAWRIYERLFRLTGPVRRGSGGAARHAGLRKRTRSRLAVVLEETQMFQYSQIAERPVPQRTVVRPTLIRHATLVLDADCTIVGCDEGVESLFGYGRRNLIGTCVAELIPDVALAPDKFVKGWREGCATLKFSRIALDARHADGSRFPVMASLLQGADRTLLLRIRSLD